MKLSPKFDGPFLILERIGTIAYKLQLPDEARIHNVFHASLFKKKVGSDQLIQHSLRDFADKDSCVVITFTVLPGASRRRASQYSRSRSNGIHFQLRMPHEKIRTSCNNNFFSCFLRTRKILKVRVTL